jgi:hypothetical protein
MLHAAVSLISPGLHPQATHARGSYPSFARVMPASTPRKGLPGAAPCSHDSRIYRRNKNTEKASSARGNSTISTEKKALRNRPRPPRVLD